MCSTPALGPTTQRSRPPLQLAQAWTGWPLYRFLFVNKPTDLPRECSEEWDAAQSVPFLCLVYFANRGEKDKRRWIDFVRLTKTILASEHDYFQSDYLHVCST
ncbi:hypothetical protein AMECASPLE_011152 [Ameca splendens]|uniref:Uncharacterized protein n=1 Tax=Ameca splendens TaxID=208324 RepID=A0ABV1A721_9TELE